MRRQITLLVAATTSVVLLAFLLPAASLVARVAETRALDAARAQLQFLIPSVGLDDRAQVTANLIGTSPDLTVAVRWTDDTWLDEVGALADGECRRARRRSRARTGRGCSSRSAGPTGRRSIEVFVPTEVLRAGVTRTWLVLGGLGVVLLLLALVVADRLARSLTRPVTDLAATAHRLGSGDLTARATPAGPRGGAGGGDGGEPAGRADRRAAGRRARVRRRPGAPAADAPHRAAPGRRGAARRPTGSGCSPTSTPSAGASTR